jgi:hypothetical protein
MNILNMLFGRRGLRLEDLHKIKELAEQVVLAVEQTARLPGPEKKRLALELLIDLVKESGLRPPLLLLDIALEAAVRLAKPRKQPDARVQPN